MWTRSHLDPRFVVRVSGSAQSLGEGKACQGLGTIVSERDTCGVCRLPASTSWKDFLLSPRFTPPASKEGSAAHQLPHPDLEEALRAGRGEGAAHRGSDLVLQPPSPRPDLCKAATWVLVFLF